MVDDIFFMGRKIGAHEMQRISECFDEKIDDIRLCQAILVLSMKKENALARGAFARAIKTGYCGFADGKREGKKLIREARRRLGYKYTAKEKIQRTRRAIRRVDGAAVVRETRNAFESLWRLIFPD